VGGACTWSICGFIWRSCLLESPNVFNHEVEWWSHPHLFHHILNQIIAATLNLSFLLHWLGWHPPWGLKNCVLMQYLRTSIIAIFFLFVSLLSWSSGVVVRSNGMHRSSNAHGTLVFFSYFFSNKWVGWKASVSKTKEILFSWLCFLGVWVPTLHLKYIVLKNRAGRYIGLQTLFFFFLLEILLLFFLPEILFVLSPISLSFSF
jgi:hypothetical protein